MKKFSSLLLCLLLSIFAVAAAMKPPHTPAANTKTAHKNPMGQEADAKTLLNDQNSNEGVASDDEDENMNDDDGVTPQAMRTLEMMPKRVTKVATMEASKQTAS